MKSNTKIRHENKEEDTSQEILKSQYHPLRDLGFFGVTKCLELEDLHHPSHSRLETATDSYKLHPTNVSVNLASKEGKDLTSIRCPS